MLDPVLVFCSPLQMDFLPLHTLFCAPGGRPHHQIPSLKLLLDSYKGFSISGQLSLGWEQLPAGDSHWTLPHPSLIFPTSLHLVKQLPRLNLLG